MSIEAGKYNFVLEQGATFILPVVYKDSDGNLIDVTGYEARMQIRETIDSVVPLISKTSNPPNGIVVNELESKFTITVPANETTSLPAPIRAFYDIEFETPAGEVIRVLEGRVRIKPEVTR